jgi:mevalonate kinase
MDTTNFLTACAPSKIILTGEHYVVYGAPALAFAIDRYNYITFEETDGPTRVECVNPSYGDFTIYPDARYVHKNNRIEMKMFANIYKYVATKTHISKAYKAVWSSDGVFKGMGASSSFSAAFAYGLYRLCGVTPSEHELFTCAQIGDEFAHKGRASGIDAKTVTAGTGIIFNKTFNPVNYNFKKFDLVFPKDTAIIIVDTFKGQRENTKDLIQKFAEHYDIKTMPAEMSTDARENIYLNYVEVYSRILEQLKINGDAELLGKLLSENHKLLSDRGVSTDDIENVITIAKQNNALGAKLTGAGGKGSAVIVYAYEKDFAQIQDALKQNEYKSLCVHPAAHGVVLK